MAFKVGSLTFEDDWDNKLRQEKIDNYSKNKKEIEQLENYTNEKRKQWIDENNKNQYHFGDITKGVLASGADIATDVGQGFLGTLEGMADWGTYRLADLSDLIGQEDWAKGLRQNADFDSTGTWFGKNQNVQQNVLGNWTKGIEEKSVIPDWGDNIAQGVGNVAGLVGTTAVTGGGNLATAAASYTSAYGNARSAAKRNGASDSDANKYGIINGISEAISEQFFSGIPGMKTAGWGDDLANSIAGKVKKYFGTKAGNAALIALDSLGEGTEEILSNAIQWAGNALANYDYGNENQTNILDFDQFLSAALTSALLGTGKAAIDTKAQNNIINAYAKENNMSFDDAKSILTQMQQQEQNKTQNEQPLEQTQMPQIEQEQQSSINNQPITEQPQIDLKQAENEVIQSPIQEVQQNSIANDSNAFNLGKINENNSLKSIRSSEDISNKQTNAYQFDNPEVKPYFRDAAYDLKDALENYTTKGERFMREDGTFGGTKFSSTKEIASLKDDYNMNYKDINRGIDGIIKDNGAENNSASKKVELVIDDMLRKGYKSSTPDTIKPNQDYLDTLSGKSVNNQINEQVDEELPFFESEEIEQTPKEQKTNKNLAEAKQEDVLKVENKPKQKQELTGTAGEQYFKDNGVDEKIAKILSEKPKEQKTNKKESLKEVAGETYRLMVSRGGEVEKIAKVANRPDVKYKYDRSMRARSEAQQHIGSGQTDLNGKLYKNFTNKNGEQVNMSLNDIRKDAKKSGISENVLNQYLADWLNVDRFVEGKPVFGNSYTSEISMENIAKLDQQYPELNRIASNVWAYEQNELKNLYESGLITENLYNKLKENKHYVRIQRNIEGSNKGPVIDRNGHISINQTLQKATGGNQDILPIMEGIADYTTKMVQNERLNEAARELANAIGVSATGDQIIDNEESFGVNPDFVKQNDDGTYTLTYFNKGVATQIPINKALYDAFVKNKTVSNIENSKVFKTLTYAPKKLSTMFRNLTTNYNPMFMATNMLKDIGDAPFNSKYTKEFLKVYTSTEALREVAGNGNYNQLYKRLGGQDDSYFTEGEFKDKSQSKIGKVKDAVLSPITKGNEIVESVPRMAEFIATIKANGYKVNQDGELVLNNSKKANGKTAQQVMDEALYNAAEVTTNFKRGGDLAKSINRNGGTFFNASIQGFDKQIRNFKDAFTSGSKKQIVGLLTKALIFGIAPTMLNDAMYSGDDEYDELQDYIKDNYYVFKAGNTWIRIPKGRAMSVLGSASRRTKDYVSGDEDAFNGFVNFAAGQVAPNNPFENNIIAPFLAVKNNKSWSGNKIVSQSMEKRPEAEQYNEKTDEFSKWLGGVLNVSPMKINYLIDQYTGGIGDVVLPMMTSKATGTTDNALLQPFVSKFTFDPTYSNKSVGNFYDTMTELEKNKYSSKADEVDKLKYSYIYSQNQKMAELKSQQSKIQSDNSLSNKEKYEQAKEIQEQINDLAKKSLKDLDNIENNKYYAIVGDNIYYLDDNGDGTQSFKKDAYADSHKKSADKKGMALYDYYKEQYEKRKEKNK